MDAAVLVSPALILVLTLMPIGEGVTSTSPRVGLAMAGADVEEGLLLRQDVHIGAGPEHVLLAPLRGLPHQADGAVYTF